MLYGCPYDRFPTPFLPALTGSRRARSLVRSRCRLHTSSESPSWRDYCWNAAPSTFTDGREVAPDRHHGPRLRPVASSAIDDHVGPHREGDTADPRDRNRMETGGRTGRDGFQVGHVLTDRNP